MSVTPKPPKHGEADSGSIGSPINTPTLGSSGHKPSFKASGKLARRARSFKEDFLEKLGAMRSPVGGASPGGGARSHSPAPKEKKPPINSHTTPSTPTPNASKDRHTSTLDGLLRQVDVALKHFRDVISKNKLEMLPGNGTIVLEAVQKVLFTALGGVTNQTGAALGGATGHTCACLTRLVKLCDDVLINGDHSAELQTENVNEILENLNQSVLELIKIARERKTIQKEALLPPIAHINSQQRNSLPDIALARDDRGNIDPNSNFENHITKSQNCQNSRLSRTSHSTESILRDSSPPPPPKPPLPHRPLPLPLDTPIITSSIPPPLPPKRRSQKIHNDIISQGIEMGASSLLHAACASLERVSLRSRSPDESSSLLSGSLDSVLNNSREDDEIHALMSSDPLSNDEGGLRDNDLVDHASFEISYNHLEETHTEIVTFESNNRLSNTDSGFVSLHSQRGSRGVEGVCGDEIIPPPVPQKQRNKCPRQPSPYDNILISCPQHQSNLQSQKNLDQDNLPPPLPVKKRHIMAYMEMFGNCAHSVTMETSTNSSVNNEYIRHSVHLVQNWSTNCAQSLDSGLTTTMSCNFVNQNGEIRPALPPKIRKSDTLEKTTPIRAELDITPPISLSPPKTPPTITSTPLAKTPPPIETQTTFIGDELTNHNEAPPPEGILEKTPTQNHATSPDLERESPEPDLMEMIEVNEYLVFKKANEDGPDLKGGFIDALIVHATKCNKKGDKDCDYSYQEAFLTTYRTFISSNDLVEKLIRRYQYFVCQPDKKPRAREAFSLLLAVVNDLTAVDLAETLSKTLMDFIYQLISGGNLDLAKPLREKFVEKYIKRKDYLIFLKKGPINQETSLNLIAGSLTLLDFKSVEIAEQMTLLDANLFMKIEIPEVLIWAQEQNEERSPNLTKFTEHFNKMSYWARTKILSIPEARDREKFVLKFIKIMKYLRKMNNFNSYLALLSALDSAPITRLEWQKHITEGLKEYCALIDSSSSFRAYRQALADTTPPCIPYIGLVLQDLTFVYIGNSNLLNDNGMINFSKRWQQFNILENMKKFKKCNYPFKRNEKIIAFFDDFQENIGEDAMWQLSESYKPRGRKMNQS